LIEHSVEELIKQRVFALALGYEDLNDHDQLRAGPLLATLVGARETAWITCLGWRKTSG